LRIPPTQSHTSALLIGAARQGRGLLYYYGSGPLRYIYGGKGRDDSHAYYIPDGE
jgi:hypothetical protein